MTIKYTRIDKNIEILDCTDSFEFEPHIHDSYVLWLNTRCPENFRIKGSGFTLDTESIGIFEPGLVHSNNPCSKNNTRLKSFYIDKAFFDTFFEQYNFKKEESFFKSRVIKDKKLHKKFEFLHDYLLLNNKDISLDTYLLETFMLFFKRHTKHVLKNFKENSDKRVKLVKEYLKENLSEKIRLKDTAVIAECTEYHLIRLFKEHTGLSPHAFLLQLRLENARKLIKKGYSITYAAMESGFSDQSHLTRRFKSRYGITPYSYST